MDGQSLQVWLGVHSPSDTIMWALQKAIQIYVAAQSATRARAREGAGII